MRLVESPEQTINGSHKGPAWRLLRQVPPSDSLVGGRSARPAGCDEKEFADHFLSKPG